MAAITPQLLDAMLSAGPDRLSAEELFKSIPLNDRASGLASYLIESGKGCSGGTAALAAVLLRNDVSSLGGTGLSPAGGQAASGVAKELLKRMAPSLLSFFLDEGVEPALRRQVGYCIAEVCLSLSLIDKAEGDAAMGAVLNGVGPGCAAADIPSLRLLSNLAERSPLTLWSVSGSDGETLRTLLQGATSNISSLEQAEAILEAVVRAGIAAQMTAKATAGKGANQVLLMIQAQTGEGGDEGKVDPKSPAAVLGRCCLPALLTALGKDCDGQDEVVKRCAQHLIFCASQCPSLLAGDMPTLTCLFKTCLAIANRPTNDDPDRIGVALSALEVLATACDVNDIKKRIVLSSALSAPGVENLLQLLLLGEGATDASNQTGVVRICTEFIVNGVDDDIEAWASDPAALQEDACSWDDDDSAIYAESLLESFLHNLGGGAASLPVVLPLVETLLASPLEQWQFQRAALSVLERCLNAAPVTFAKHVPIAVETALRLSSHPCERVKFQAMQLLGTLCHADTVNSDFISQPIHVRTPFGGRILQAISEVVRSSCPKVSSHASLAIVSFCRGGDGREDCGASVDKAQLLPYLQDVLTALTSGPLSVDVSNPTLVEAGAVTVLVRAISAVACLADAVGESFGAHYASILPGLLECAQFGLQLHGENIQAAPNSMGHDFAILRGAAIESSTIVGQAVGSDSPDAFVPDAEKIMGIILPLLKAAEGGMDVSSIIPMDQLLAASARIANVMGEKYAPFVPAVLPHLIKRATEEAEVSVVKGDEAGLEATKRGEYFEEEGTESVTVALPGMGIRKLVMSTTQMQEKAQAARAVYEHANAMGVAFGPFSEACLSAFIPLVGFKYSAEVRATSAQALGPVFNAACEYAVSGKNENLPGQALSSLSKVITQQLQLEDPEDPETLFALADSLSEAFYSAFRHKKATGGASIAALGSSEACSTVSQVVEIAKSCFGRRAKILAVISGADGTIPDEDEMAQYYDQLQSEADLLTELVNTIGYTLKLLGEDFVPIFDQVVSPVFGPLLTLAGTNDVRARFAAVCLYDDCIEYCGATTAAKYAPMLAIGAMQGLDEDEDDLRTVSAYGIAQIARHAPRCTLDQLINPIMNNLIQIAGSAVGQDKDDVENLSLVENAVSAMASLALFGGSPYAGSGGFDKKSLLEIFLGNLPLREDEDEAKICHDGLCDLIDANVIDIATSSRTLVQIISQILALVEEGEGVATQPTCSRLAAIMNQLQEVSGDVVKTVFSSLPLDVQASATRALTRSGNVGARGNSPVSVSRLMS